ncbi:MAG: LD-carboxypeptidase [Bacteroidetes bacterium]|nr:MAG: LD-carboxypeptidase [Bacteroidota bacterium]
MVKIPPYLKAGDTIGMVCPAGYKSLEDAQAAINAFQSWGYNVKLGKTVGGDSKNYFSGTDEARLDDLQRMLDEDEVRAVFCARGGYGIGRIIERMDFKKYKKEPKWIIGFSDVTVLHAHIYTNYGVSTIHGPMASAFVKGEPGNPYINSLKNVLEGHKIKYYAEPHEMNRKGEAVGELVGGNLTLLAHLTGSSSELKTKGRILFLEDVGEYLYNIDRMLYQLKRSGKLDKLAGLVVGGFTETKDTERPFGKNVYEIIHDVVSEYRYPVCFGFAVSHEKENYALKTGIGYKLRVNKNKVSLEE